MHAPRAPQTSHRRVTTAASCQLAPRERQHQLQRQIILADDASNVINWRCSQNTGSPLHAGLQVDAVSRGSPSLPHAQQPAATRPPQQAAPRPPSTAVPSRHGLNTRRLRWALPSCTTRPAQTDDGYHISATKYKRTCTRMFARCAPRLMHQRQPNHTGAQQAGNAMSARVHSPTDVL